MFVDWLRKKRLIYEIKIRFYFIGRNIMKTKIAAIICAFFVAVGSYAADVITRDTAKLPDSARAYIAQNFAKTPVNAIKIDKDWFSIDEYEVFLSDGTKVEFDGTGVFKSAKNRAGLPSAVIPKEVADCVSKNYAGNKVVELKVKKYGYKIKLSDSSELKVFGKGVPVCIDED